MVTLPLGHSGGPLGKLIPELFGRVLRNSVADMAKVLGFPNPVNEISARIVATGVVTMGVAFIAFRSGWILVPLTYGFLARVLTGPTLSPLGRLSTQVVTPALERRGHVGKLVAGPPKRFAQSIGLAFTTVASMFWIMGAESAAVVTIALLVAAASLEAALNICCGCLVFAGLMKVGVIPEAVCVECNNIALRQRRNVSDGMIAVGE